MMWTLQPLLISFNKVIILTVYWSLGQRWKQSKYISTYENHICLQLPNKLNKCNLLFLSGSVIETKQTLLWVQISPEWFTEIYRKPSKIMIRLIKYGGFLGKKTFTRTLE